MDFAWLVAAAYSAWSICNNGLSSSIALSQASHGNALNLVEKATGHVIPLSETVFAPFVIVPTVLVIVIMASIFIMIYPRPENVIAFTGRYPRQRPTRMRTRRTRPLSHLARNGRFLAPWSLCCSVVAIR